MYTYKKIEVTANKLLKSVKIRSVPVDVEEIAEFLNIRIFYEDLDEDVSGFLAVECGNATAVINKNQHPNRQRFTIAHEIGHFVLHASSERDKNLFIDKKYTVHHRDHKSCLGTLKAEREANLFASVLLMPKDLIGKLLDESGLDFFDDSETFSLSKKLGVSEQALGFRLARLNYEVGE